MKSQAGTQDFKEKDIVEEAENGRGTPANKILKKMDNNLSEQMGKKREKTMIPRTSMRVRTGKLRNSGQMCARGKESYDTDIKTQNTNEGD